MRPTCWSACTSPLFARWQERRDAGARILLVSSRPTSLARLQSPPGLKEAVLHAAERWGKAREIRRSSDAGTDLTWKRGEFRSRANTASPKCKAASINGAPAISTHFPTKARANGTVVLQPGDFFILPYIRYRAAEVRLEIRDGFIRKVEGSVDAKAFTHWLDRNKSDARMISIPMRSRISASALPSACASGTHQLCTATSRDRINRGARLPGNFLFSTGPNNDRGGKRDTKGHIDTPMIDCTVLLDNEVVMERGKFTDEKMQVAFVPR